MRRETKHTEMSASRQTWPEFATGEYRPYSLSVPSVNSSELGERVRTIRSFTLVELMLVMGVIVILVAMLFPVVIGTKDKARKKQALTEAHAIALALKGYHMEFGKWPNQTQANTDTTYFASNCLVIRPLIGYNPRGKVFLSVQATNQTDSVTNFTDPWGVPYVICLDENMDGVCEIYLKDVVYINNFAVPQTIYSYSATNYFTNYIVANVEVAVASFTGTTNAYPSNNAFQVESWSAPQ